MKKQKGWTSVYCAVPVLSASVLRVLAYAAGVHLYTATPEVIYADRNMVCLNAYSSGSHTIHLPAFFKVESVYPPGLFTAASTSEITFPLAAGETALFRIEPAGKNRR